MQYSIGFATKSNKTDHQHNMRMSVCLFDCFEPREQFFSYLAAVTIIGDRIANLDLCLALTAVSSEGSFMYHTYCDTGPPFLRSYPKDL
jgi:hypothetical protein